MIMFKSQDKDPTWILSFNAEQANLLTVGGKGANLARLNRAGLPVPGGFLITTSAYRLFTEANNLEEQIQALLPKGATAQPEALENASRRIRLLFKQGEIPISLADEILDGYRQIDAGSVAVRSSATAEDLPELSFAGQQDTYLNVLGEKNLLEAVVACWSSLWTARAIGYRMRNRVPNQDIHLAVVVQQMVESQASGVLFTANPLSGLRSETVIDAALGLGEALVSGQVEPDHYVIDSTQERILSKTLGSKELSIHGQAEGGTRALHQKRTHLQALTDEQILALARLGKQVEALFDFPQDIEWAWANERLHLLQSRPITSLYPLPEGMPAEPLKVMFSFAAVQGIMDPLTPLGQDALRWIATIAAKLFDKRKTYHTQTVFILAGERLWANFTALIRNSVGRKILPAIFNQVEPTIRQAIQQIWDDPRLQPGREGISLHARAQLLRFFLPLVFNVLRNLAAPQKRRLYIVDRGERLLQQLENDCQQIGGDRSEKLAQRTMLFTRLLENDLPGTFLLFVSGVAAGMASWNLLKKLASSGNDPGAEAESTVNDLVLQVTRGMPYNPTTEMDLTLWEMSRTVRRDEPSRENFRQQSSRELAARFLARDLPDTLLQVIDAFLARYGGRGFGEIDLGRTRWAEDPTHVFEMLASFLQIEDESQAPDVVFARAASSAQQSIDSLGQIVGKTKWGWFKARLVRFLAGRARQLMGVRENPKFFAVRMMWIIRRELLKSGEEFVQSGELAQAEDVFFLKFDELESLAAGEGKDWRSLIAARRAAYQREQQRRQIPRLLLSDGRAFYEGINSIDPDENSLNGSPVSPGSVEGRVRVVLDPRQAGLQPGEILVCPGTDPSWTPLFLSAAGLVMETGGMMTHGAVVAREYGIPAVVGVDKATQRLQTGQWIRMDGSSGLIVIKKE